MKKCEECEAQVAPGATTPFVKILMSFFEENLELLPKLEEKFAKTAATENEEM